MQGQGNSYLKPSPIAIGGFITLNSANGVSIPDIKSNLRSKIIGRILRITFYD